eukprot:3921760-Rhodomonas_salina.1
MENQPAPASTDSAHSRLHVAGIVRAHGCMRRGGAGGGLWEPVLDAARPVLRAGHGLRRGGSARGDRADGCTGVRGHGRRQRGVGCPAYEVTPPATRR